MKGYRTLAVNALSLVIILCGWDQITQYVSPEILAAILAIANALLRLITSTPVGQGVAKVVLVALLVAPLAGCALGDQLIIPSKMSAEQLKEWAKVKDATLGCAKGTYAGANILATWANVDKGIPAGVTIGDDCKITFDSKTPVAP